MYRRPSGGAVYTLRDANQVETGLRGEIYLACPTYDSDENVSIGGWRLMKHLNWQKMCLDGYRYLAPTFFFRLPT